MKKFRVLLLAAATLPVVTPAQSPSGNNNEAKYIILMVPDGMGLADVTATRIRLNGPAGAPLNLETLDHVGYLRTYSQTNTVTDSSAAASALACGEKFVNNEVCYSASRLRYNSSVLELAKARGMTTGLVATQTITHATPASFAAHVAKRTCETEIARQYITDSRPDVLLGGGQATFSAAKPDACGVSGDHIALAVASGYTYVNTSTMLRTAVTAGVPKLLGLFAAKNLTPEYQRKSDTTEPRLPEMTAAALSLLQRNPAGFFLMVEGSLIDSGNHAENLDYQFGEMAAFDEAVKVVLDWIGLDPVRKDQTLLIVAPDHETGGFVVHGSETPNAGLGLFTAGWAFTLKPDDPKDFESHHTGGDVMIWSQGPGSEALARPIDNTMVYHVVKSALRM